LSAIDLSGLRVEIVQTGAEIVDDVSFTVEPGEILGIVGETGSGKSTVGGALLGYARKGARIADGTVSVTGVDVLSLSASQLRDYRGRVMSYVPQDPAAALNPAKRLRSQLVEGLRAHQLFASDALRLERVRDVLAAVQLPNDDQFLRRFPHQLSGGQQQRVFLAMAFAAAPSAILLDEPTTGLDVTTQAYVLNVLRDLCRDNNVAAVYITHDLAVAYRLADAVAVMYAGQIVESGTAEDIFSHPCHPYTRGLLTALPDFSVRGHLEAIPGIAPRPGRRPNACFFSARCSFATPECLTGIPSLTPMGTPAHDVRCIRAAKFVNSPVVRKDVAPRSRETPTHATLVIDSVRARYGEQEVLKGVSLGVSRGECVAIVGESGSGKTSLARAIVGLLPVADGTIYYDGAKIQGLARDRPDSIRRAVQLVFQNPYSSLNPRQRVLDILGLPLWHFDQVRGRKALPQVTAALDLVGLPADYIHRFPHELSGGERQRVAIARAIICRPEILICDEVTSSLDVSVQAHVISILEEFRRREQGLGIMFITHNLGLVRSFAGRVVVMKDGSVVDGGLTDELLDEPNHAYTRQLLADTPTLSTAPTGGG
jgi:peptide/nickel transport system ATP-binding protein